MKRINKKFKSLNSNFKKYKEIKINKKKKNRKKKDPPQPEIEQEISTFQD